MKKNENFILSEVAGEYVLVPCGNEAVKFNGIINLNETAKFLWEKIDGEFNKEALVSFLLEAYDDVDSERAEKSAEKFITALKEVGAIE